MAGEAFIDYFGFGHSYLRLGKRRVNIDNLHIKVARPILAIDVLNKYYNENDVLISNDTGILGKRNSEFSQQESNLRPCEKYYNFRTLWSPERRPGFFKSEFTYI